MSSATRLQALNAVPVEKCALVCHALSAAQTFLLSVFQWRIDRLFLSPNIWSVGKFH